MGIFDNLMKPITDPFNAVTQQASAGLNSFLASMLAPLNSMFSGFIRMFANPPLADAVVKINSNIDNSDVFAKVVASLDLPANTAEERERISQLTKKLKTITKNRVAGMMPSGIEGFVGSMFRNDVAKTFGIGQNLDETTQSLTELRTELANAIYESMAASGFADSTAKEAAGKKATAAALSIVGIPTEYADDPQAWTYFSNNKEKFTGVSKIVFDLLFSPTATSVAPSVTTTTLAVRPLAEVLQEITPQPQAEAPDPGPAGSQRRPAPPQQGRR